MFNRGNSMSHIETTPRDTSIAKQVKRQQAYAKKTLNHSKSQYIPAGSLGTSHLSNDTTNNNSASGMPQIEIISASLDEVQEEFSH